MYLHSLTSLPSTLSTSARAPAAGTETNIDELVVSRLDWGLPSGLKN